MKLARLSVFLALPLIFGCATVKAPTPPLAPGYTSPADQTLGQSLAAVNGFVHQEILNYDAKPAAQQASEKTYLNSLIDATSLANTAYVAFHGGSGTLAQAQAALTTAQNAQTALAAQKEGK
jgi:hypothetical protein